ncbi:MULTISPECIES: DUF2116 family Zn-ribbon domain-containing protein [unclassified Aureimonas]|uniref:DUF2116 family Zn-ribbon domain-containing protein n=1 Tax=unclassified Aureimonas TaxID=2615206 RepID=UPI002A4E2477|nr:DUF2116 family Zn-ribbon domain-containing protein [Aureimonas sp. Leaf427]
MADERVGVCRGASRHYGACEAAQSVEADERRPVAMTTARVHACAECGEAAPAAAEFCSPACRHTFNNRRRLRGAELYDLYMAHRFERPLAKVLGLLQAMNRLASNYRAEDALWRAGRKSWRAPQDVLATRPHLKAKRWFVRAGR